VKLHARSNQNAAVPTVVSPSNLVAVGRKLDRIHNYEANFPEEDSQAIAVAPIGGAINVRCELPLRRALCSGAMVRFAQKIL
jgi:hypothetical protein